MNYTQWSRTCVFSGHKSSPVRGLRGDKLDWRLGLQGLYILSWQRSGGRRTELLKNFLTQARIQRGLGSEFILHVSSLVCLLSRVWLYPMDCSPPGSSAQGIFQARIMQWGAISYSRGSSWPRDQTLIFCLADRFFITSITWEANKWL